MNGILGTWNLYAGVPQAIYVCNNTDASVVSLNVCNQNNIDVKITVALSTSATAPTNNEYLEYETTLLGKGVLERSGIVVGPTQYLVVISNRPNVIGVCWGVEQGDAVVSPTVIVQNTVSPTWSTAATLPDITTSGSSTITLTAL